MIRTTCAALPGVVLGALSLVWLAMAAAGHGHPFWRSAAGFTLSEAVAARDAAEVARLVESGQDPNRTYAVRPGLLEGFAGSITPLEAARRAERPEITELLIALGATP